MLEALAQNAVGAAAGAGAAGVVRGAPSVTSIARFNAALQGQSSDGVGTVTADGTGGVAASDAAASGTAPSTAVSALASNVRDTLRGVSTSWHQVAQTVQQGVGVNGDMSLADLTRIQMTTLGAMFQIDLTTKIITKPPQIIDQLVKTQ
ncbi:hypothetical protein [Robbsia sp. KACC 23696]|uniref:hypothetical protein n=1 Tax=Robbsia sp. KACC 23696 TaxID=3149231 RepID=UPI00325B122D